MDTAVHWINLYPVDSAVSFVNTYPLDSVIGFLNDWSSAYALVRVTDFPFWPWALETGPRFFMCDQA